MARGAQKRQFAEQLVQIRVLSDEATKRKIDQQPKIQQQIQFNRDNILAGAMFQALQQDAKVDDAAVEKYYNDHKSDFETVRASHILIRVKGAPMPAAAGKTELTDEQALAKAQEIRKKIAAGEDFAKLAQAESDDTGSAVKGGDLGEFKKGMMVPPFEQAAFAAKVGEVTDPVKSQFGYHIIKVEAHTTKTLEEAKPEILAKLRPDAAKAALESHASQRKVTLDDSFFGPAAPTGPTLSTREIVPGRLFAGTSGFSYPAWKPAFYPKEVPSKKFLEYYATRLNSVEVNYTFRRLAPAKTFEGWLAATSADFAFTCKAHQNLTHILKMREAESFTDLFLKSLEPLRAARRLGPILFQFPPTFKCDIERLDAYLPLLPSDLRYAFEFRHESWLDDAVYERLKNRNIALVPRGIGPAGDPAGYDRGLHVFPAAQGRLFRRCARRRSWNGPDRCLKVHATSTFTSNTKKIRTARSGPRNCASSFRAK